MDFLHRAWAEIDLSALKNNFCVLQKKANGAKLCAVVKADAYGHGVNGVALTLQSAGTDAFAVSNIDEAEELRKIGITKDILVLGYTPVSMAKRLSDINITQAVYDITYAEELNKNAKENDVKVKAHIKLDTGMGRIGFDCRSDNSDGINEALKVFSLENIAIEGAFTHFAVADRSGDEKGEFTNLQYNRFCNAVEKIEKSGYALKIKHCCNSAGLLLEDNKHIDMCRPGIILYGLTPDMGIEIDKEFIPVMTFKASVAMVKTIKKGETVSYGRTFTAKEDMKIATVTVGYADGYPRALSNKGEMLLNGKKAKIIGKVCMDQTIIDVSHIENVNIGDEVELFGKELSVNEIAELSGTINYEILCGISKRVPRIII